MCAVRPPFVRAHGGRASFFVAEPQHVFRRTVFPAPLPLIRPEERFVLQNGGA